MSNDSSAKEPSKKADFRASIFNAFLCLFLIYISWFSIVPSILTRLHDSWSVKSWHETTATVLKARYKNKDEFVFVGHSIELHYLYSIDNEEHVGRRYSLQSTTAREGNAVDQLNKGDEISIFFNPDAPWRSVIDSIPTPSTWDCLLAVFFGLAPFFVIAKTLTTYVAELNQNVVQKTK